LSDPNSSDSYFPLGAPPRDDVEAAARLLNEYRAKKLLTREFGEMFSMMVDDFDAVIARAFELVPE
jgi:hypothetical protein